MKRRFLITFGIPPVPVLFVTIFASVIPASIILPMLPFIGQKYGATSFQISLLFTLMPALMIFVAPIWGKLSDKFGRKPIFMISLASSSLTFIIFGLADSIDSMFVARALQGITGGNVSIGFAMIADSTTHGNRAKYLGYGSGATALAFFIGPVFGGLLMGSDLDTFTHAMPSYLAAGLGALATLIGVVFLKETRPGEKRRTALRQSQNDTEIISDTVAKTPRVTLGRVGLTLLIIQFFIGGYVSGSDQFSFAFWAQGLHDWGPNNVSFGMASMGLAYMVATIGLVGPLSKRFGDVGAYFIGAIINLAGLSTFLYGSNVWVSIAGLWVAIIGIGLWNTVLFSVLTKVSPEDKVGYMLGLSNGTAMVGRVVGPLIAGSFFLDINPVLPFVVTLGLVLIVAVNATRLIIIQRRAASS
ncbi:MAG: MFS transporter [Rhodospirillaceae bacterium]|nr:MFS transporter [Rhodospirillaceae bacterium]